MEKILDYHILQKLNETNDTITYRCQKEDQDRHFIIRILKNVTPYSSDITRFKQKFNEFQNVGIKGVINIYETTYCNQGFVFVLEDFDGISLDKLLAAESLSLENFLQIGIKLAEILGVLHKNDIVHKNINPKSILINQKTLEVKIANIAFASSTLQNPQWDDIRDTEFIKRTLAYISPAQTGRINQPVDHRTDLYSLGIIFYQILTGNVPFLSKDPLEVIYSHIAEKPQPPEEINPNIPDIISHIVMKLLSKTFEERYQNSFGLMADLQECYDQLKDHGEIKAFEIGKKDYPLKYVESQVLVGREKEIEFLLHLYKQVSRKSKEIVLVSGRPGIGKSTLMNQVHNLVAAEKGYFISGKHDQFSSRDIPYRSIIQAFHGLVTQILSESKDRVNLWRKNLLDVLGFNGKVVIDIIPDLEFIIGKQPEPVELGPEEARNRFNYMVEKLFVACTKEGHPILLFLDDLQWADQASLQLIKAIILSRDITNFLIVGAYRDNEVDDTHPLFNTFSEIKREGVNVNELSLSRLTEKEVADLIVGSFKCSEDKGITIAEKVHRKTNGNPFFVNQFLHTLYYEKLLELDAIEGWKWDIDKISQMQVTSNVVELMVDIMNKLSTESREVLKIGACIGSSFNLEILTAMIRKPIDDVLSSLTEVMRHGSIYLLNDEYVFHHDKIQEAAYSLVPKEDRKLLHYRIGRLSLEGMDENDLQGKLFYVVDQINHGIEFVVDPNECEEVAWLNLNAGKKAKISAVYSLAIKYLETGISLLKNECWEKQYDLTLSLYTELVNAVYLKGDFQEMERLVEVVTANARSAIDQVGVFETSINACFAQEDYTGAIKTALGILKSLGLKMPENPTMVTVIKELIKVKFYMSGKTNEDLRNLPRMSEQRFLSSVRILSQTGLAAMVFNKNLYALILLRRVHLTLKYGVNPDSAFAYVSYGVFLINALGDVNGGIRFGDLAMDLLEDPYFGSSKCRVMTTYNYLIRHWKEHLKKAITSCLEAYHIGRETGDHVFSAASLVIYDGYCYILGKDLKEIWNEIAEHNKAIEQLHQKGFFQGQSLYYLSMTAMLDQTTDYVKRIDNVFDEEKIVLNYIEKNNYPGLSFFYTYRAVTYYFVDENKKALKDIEQAEKYLKEVKGQYMSWYLTYLDALVRLALYPEVSRYQKKIYMKRVKKNQKKIRKWAKFAPMNNLPWLSLIDAEKEQVLGNYHQARKLYDIAVEQSRKYEYASVELMALMKAGKFCLAEGKNGPAKEYISEAYTVAIKNDNISCKDFLQRSYPDQFLSTNRMLPDMPESSIALEKGVNAFDLLTVMKVSQALSGEITLEKLLTRLIKIILENAGAEKAVILLKNDDGLYIEAEYSAGEQNPNILQSIPLENCMIVPESIIHFVIRTGETVALENATAEQLFSNDPYIQKKDLKSILCIPLIYQDKMTAVLYLENKVIKGAFTTDRQEILKILAAQASISLENALLFDALKKEVTLRKKAEEEQFLLEKKILNISEEERRKIGMELHDGLGHDLFDISLKIGMLADKLGDQKLPEVSDAMEVENRVIKAIKKSRGLAKGLLPAGMEDTTFIEIIESTATGLERNHNIQCITEIDSSFEDLNIPISSHLYHIIQEAVKNIIKHANAKNVKISLGAENSQLSLAIRDDGVGLSAALKKEDGNGISIMQYRARMIDAVLDIRNRTNRGLEVICRFDIERLTYGKP